MVQGLASSQSALLAQAQLPLAGCRQTPAEHRSLVQALPSSAQTAAFAAYWQAPATHRSSVQVLASLQSVCAAQTQLPLAGCVQVPALHTSLVQPLPSSQSPSATHAGGGGPGGCAP